MKVERTTMVTRPDGSTFEVLNYSSNCIWSVDAFKKRFEEIYGKSDLTNEDSKLYYKIFA